MLKRVPERTASPRDTVKDFVALNKKYLYEKLFMNSEQVYSIDEIMKYT